MDNDLISKKDLLELTEISYGQLYRWKRKKLVPEEWFIRKSTFTGQETFFPRDKILERINKIKNMKDDLSLDDIAGVFSPELTDVLLKRDELIERNIVKETALEMYAKYHGENEVYSFEKILYIYVLDKLLMTGSLSLDEGRIVFESLQENYKKFIGRQCEIIFIRKLGVGMCLLMPVPNEFYIDDMAKVVERVNLSKCIEELKPVVK